MTKRKKNYQGTGVLEVLEGAKNYNAWIASAIEPHLLDPILEVGSGIGNISEYFLNRDLTVSDMDADLVQRFYNNHLANKKLKHRTLNIENDSRSDAKSLYKSVFAVNVLEHIKDDEKALSNINKLLAKRGKMILLVPAKERAYTNLDKKLGHFRRYEKIDLYSKVVRAGFEIEELYFFNFVGLFSWIVREKIDSGSGDLKPTHVAIFDKIVPVLKVIERRFRPFLGISLIVVATKK